MVTAHSRFRDAVRSETEDGEAVFVRIVIRTMDSNAIS